MNDKRKGNRGRVLHNADIQRKDGRYQFKYIDSDRKEKFVYSWRPDHNDAMLPGKVRTLSLREMDRKIQADGKSYSSIHSLRGVLRPGVLRAGVNMPKHAYIMSANENEKGVKNLIKQGKTI